MGETQENRVTHQNGPNLHFQILTSLAENNKRMWRVVVRNFRGQAGSSHEEGKQMFGKQVCRDNGKERGILADFSRFLPEDTRSLCCSLLWWWLLPGTCPLFMFLRQLRGRSSFLPESYGPCLFSAWNNPIPKRCIGMTNFIFLQKQLSACRMSSCPHAQ